MVKITPVEFGFSVTTNSMHCSGFCAPQQVSLLEIIGLVQDEFTFAERFTLNTGVVGPQITCDEEVVGKIKRSARIKTKRDLERSLT
jgi:hypothetical protein